jgi:hypothetical protein
MPSECLPYRENRENTDRRASSVVNVARRYLLFRMFNWDFVKADPVTYRAIDGAICFEVTVERENCKGTVTVGSRRNI